MLDKDTFKTPILFLIFNRPDTTKKVFKVIRKIKPKFLYVAADGHRDWVEGEDELCKETRNIVEKIDWDCEVNLLFRKDNLGCGPAVSGAIDWLFQHEEEGIILEDDCLPSISFFNYCSQLLEYYRNDTRIGQISGYNAGKVDKSTLSSDYFFSKYGMIWGWATWKRAWNLYDFNMKVLKDDYMKSELQYYYRNKNTYTNKLNAFELILNGKLNTWDYQWGLTKIIHSMYSIIPRENLIENIGFDENATHTTTGNSESYSELKIDSHPKFILKHQYYDSNFDHPYTFNEWKGGIKNNLRKLLKKRI